MSRSCKIYRTAFLHVPTTPSALVLVLGILAGCSSVDLAMSSDAGIGRDAADSIADGRVELDGALAPVDAASPDLGTNDGGASIPGPNPPAGAVLCGQGPVTPFEVQMACTVPDACITASAQCSAVATSGASWQVWCGTDQTYLWARFDNVENTGSLHCGSSFGAIDLTGGMAVTGAGCGSTIQVTLYDASGQPTPSLPFGQKHTGIVSAIFAASPHGAVTLQPVGGCQLTGDRAVLLGVTLTW